MQLIVSDVTYMHSEICVAGWNADEERMIRPLSRAGHHWAQALAGNLFSMGSVVEIVPSDDRNTRGLPHQREDMIVRGQPRLIRILPNDEIAMALADSETPSLAELFCGEFRDNRYVMAGTDCPSLGAVPVERNTIRFYEEVWDGRRKLRCRFCDQSGQFYSLAASATHLRNTWNEDGIQGLNDIFGGQGLAHVRVGLAHPMENGRAFAMVNGVALI